MSNYSLYSVPLVWVIGIVPHWYAISLTKKKGDRDGLPGFRNTAPRDFIARCRALEKQTPTVGRYLRAEAASQNGMDNVALYAAAIAVGNLVGLEASTMNGVAGIYVVSRIVYNFLYILTTKERKSVYRTGAYGVGLFSCFYCFVKAGIALNKAGGKL